jgi:hypothetical protein
MDAGSPSLFEDALGTVGALANVITAFAAVAALKLWRKQVAGASHHELAKKVSGALRLAAIARREVVEALRSLDDESEDLNRQIARALAPESVRRGGAFLGDAVEELEALEGQVAVQWGDAVLGLIVIIRSESKGLFNYAAAEYDPKIKDSPRGYLAIFAPPNIAPSYTGSAFSKALDLYTQLAQDWLAVHVGRDAARAMDADELDERRKRIDEEVVRLGEPERLTLDKEAAQRAKRIADLGGPLEMVRRYHEQRAAEEKADK